MPYRFEWLLEERIMLSYISGEATVADFRTTNDESVKFSESVSHDSPVHTILDGRNITKMPNMAEMLAIKFKRPKNTGWVVMILATNRLSKFIGSTMSQLLGFHFRIVETWQEAVDILASVDPSLPDLSYLPEKMQDV